MNMIRLTRRRDPSKDTAPGPVYIAVDSIDALVEVAGVPTVVTRSATYQVEESIDAILDLLGDLVNLIAPAGEGGAEA